MRDRETDAVTTPQKGKIKMEKCFTISDGGCLVFGNSSFTVSVYNGFGDCKNKVYIFDKESEFLDWLEENYKKRWYSECGFDSITTLKGDFVLYKYDCLSDKEKSRKKNIAAIFNGRYHVYVRCCYMEYPIIAIVKKESDFGVG